MSQDSSGAELSPEMEAYIESMANPEGTDFKGNLKGRHQDLADKLRKRGLI